VGSIHQYPDRREISAEFICILFLQNRADLTIATRHMELTMKPIIGIVLVLAGVVMTVVARPSAGGQSAIPLMHIWSVGQLYVLTVLLTLVVGFSICLSAMG
jgi:hypothetical protein